jgi:acetamidase/formamidase
VARFELPRARMKHSVLTRALSPLLALTAAASTLSAAPVKADYHLTAEFKNMVAGFYSADTPPVLKIKSGQVVAMDTLALMGMSDDKPEQFFIDNHISLDLPSVKQMIAVKKALVASKGTGILMGPIFIEGAAPGDTLEVRILDIQSFTPFGINIGTPGKGGIPDLVPRPYSKFINFDLARNVAKFSNSVTVPLAQFQGMYAVAPTAERGKLPFRPPYADIGGNMDNKYLKKGATIYLPVLVPGALFHVGDPHAAQGNGEVSQSAIESSNTVTLQFIVRKDLHIKAVRAETPTHYIIMGMDENLDVAMHKAIEASVAFLGEAKGMNFFDALSLNSIGIDYEVTEVVDVTKVISAMIPKSLFDDHKASAYWYKEAQAPTITAR